MIGSYLKICMLPSLRRRTSTFAERNAEGLVARALVVARLPVAARPQQQRVVQATLPILGLRPVLNPVKRPLIT